MDDQGIKLYETKDKVKLFTQHWRKIFKISDEENTKFCTQTERNTITNLETNRLNITPYERINFTRLQSDNILIKPITMAEVKNTLRSFRNRKAPGQSRINKEIMINLPDNVMNHYLHILNASLSVGLFPDKFKKAILKMITKAGKTPTLVCNYRPISLLETAGKLYEKIINNRLRQYLEDNNLNNLYQHSYRQKRGTQTATALLYEKIANSQINRQQCSVIFRDVSKAFDKVWHPGLKERILQLHLPRCFTALLCNFLDERQAAIKIDDDIGETFPLLSGVPQGSALSPLLCNIYVANIGQLDSS